MYSLAYFCFLAARFGYNLAKTYYCHHACVIGLHVPIISMFTDKTTALSYAACMQIQEHTNNPSNNRNLYQYGTIIITQKNWPLCHIYSMPTHTVHKAISCENITNPVP